MADNQTAVAAPVAEPWQGPRFTLRWPGYFRPNADDMQKGFAATDVGIKGGFVTKRKAVEMNQRILGVDNVDAYLDSLQEEQAGKDAKQAERDEQQLKKLTEMAHVQGKPEPGKPGLPGQPPTPAVPIKTPVPPVPPKPVK